MRGRLMQMTGSAFLLVGILLDLRGFRAVVNPGMGGSSTLALIGSPLAVLGVILFVATIWETAVVVERSRVIKATPERAWSLLSSPAVWSLRPGRFAFDVTVPGVTGAGAGQLRVSLLADSRRLGGDVLEVTGEEPGRRVSLHTAGVTGPGAVALTFSVIPDARPGHGRHPRQEHGPARRRARGAGRVAKAAEGVARRVPRGPGGPQALAGRRAPGRRAGGLGQATGPGGRAEHFRDDADRRAPEGGLADHGGSRLEPADKP